MELILKKDVENLGFVDDIVTVKPGYGRNYLIPQGYAVLATPSAKKMLEEVLKQRAYKEQKHIDAAKEKVAKLKAITLKIAVKAGNDEKLFGSVTSADLAASLAKEGIDIDKKYISILGGTIKRLGQYEAKLRFHREVIEKFNFDVVAEA